MANEYYPQNPQTQQMPAQHARQPQYQQQYQSLPQQMRMPGNEVTSMGEWVLNLFLLAIPIVGLVLLFVWAFGSNTAASKQNWARANLIWILIAFVLSIIIGIAAGIAGVSLSDVYRAGR